MKAFLTIIMLAFLPGIISQSYAQETKTASSKEGISPSSEILYFHYSRRCATCNAVEAVAKAVAEESSDGKVAFAHFNMDEKAGEEKAESLKISGQTLLITGKNGQIDLTSEAFMLAKNNPEKLKKKLRETLALLQ